jgi:predicted peptidase
MGLKLGAGALTLIALSFRLTICAAQGVEDSPLPTSGFHSLTLLRPDQPEIHYSILIPRGYSPSKPVPLVLALHFAVPGGNAAGAGRDLVQILVAPGLGELSAIIVAPDSVRGDWSSPENETAVNALLDRVESGYAIDPKKIVVTGYSMGGAGAWHFGEKFPSRFSAVIPVAGRPPASSAGWHLPVLAIHSRDDQVVPFAPTEARITELQKSGVNAKLIVLTGITHFETYRFRDALRQAIPWLREVWK